MIFVKDDRDEKLTEFLNENQEVDIERDRKGNVKNIIFSDNVKDKTFMVCDDKVLFIMYSKKDDNDIRTFSPYLPAETYLKMISDAETKYCTY